jgi:ReqiPepy6 Gp37-like protein
MELYTLTSRFLPKESIGEFTSAIWTERYSSAGDVQLVVPATSKMLNLLTPGTFLGLRGTMEIMSLETQSIENNLLTVTGSSVLKFLNERQAWFKNTAYDGSDVNTPLYAEFTSDTYKAGQLISDAVYQTVISATPFDSYWTGINLDWAADDFPGLILGDVDDLGTPQRFSIPIGPLYDSIQRFAQEQGVGLKLYLRSASYDSGFVFKFATYRGKDRTSDNPNSNMLVRLTPKMDALSGVKELRSISQYKNVFYVEYKNEISTHYIPGLAPPVGFDRRTLLVKAEDIFFDPALPDYADKVAAYRAQTAANAIANHLYILAIDGNVSSKIPYVYGVDYGLGDVIELQGYTETFSKARVVEFIRSQDQYGEQEYPTLAVLDPVFIGTIPDLEPDDDDHEWEDDTDFDLDPDDDVDEDPEHEPPEDTYDDGEGGSHTEDPNPEPTPDFSGPPVADFTWEIT